MLLDNFIIGNEKVVTKLNVSFNRKGKNHNKDIFIFLSPEMKSNLLEASNIQFFSDITYYAVLPGNKKYKLFILLSFNQNKFKTLLCLIALITNENTETFQKYWVI